MSDPDTIEILRVEDNPQDLKLPKVDVMVTYQLGVNSYSVKPVGFQKFQWHHTGLRPTVKDADAVAGRRSMKLI